MILKLLPPLGNNNLDADVNLDGYEEEMFAVERKMIQGELTTDGGFNANSPGNFGGKFLLVVLLFYMI